MKTRIKYLLLIFLIAGSSGCGENKTKPADNSHGFDPDSILFTTPTLENSLPSFRNKTDSCISIHEDEWRQIEFISKEHKSYIVIEIEKIKDIFDNHSHKSETYIGFKKIAVRDLIRQPLSVDFSKLRSLLSDKPIKIHGLCLENNPGQVEGGFYFSVNGVNYYGVQENNIVKIFCILSADSAEQLKAASDKLSKFLAAEKLYLLDWRVMHIFDETNVATDLVKDN